MWRKRFLAEGIDGLDRNVAPSLDIHLVLDNGSSHTSKATKAWLAAHPRFVAHYTPKHASWVNMVWAVLLHRHPQGPQARQLRLP